MNYTEGLKSKWLTNACTRACGCKFSTGSGKEGSSFDLYAVHKNETMLLPAMIAINPSRCVMTASPAQEPARSTDQALEGSNLEEERILCNHCRRTASNGIRCLGMCVADSDY